MKYLLIDGNNLAIRHAMVNEGMVNSEGISTSIHFGVMSSLMSLKKRFPHHQFLMVWDGKSKRRKNESEEGIRKGLIKTAYKANRKKTELPQGILNFYEQANYLKRGIEQLGLPQIKLLEFEADDVIASYSNELKDCVEEIICITSDKDYYQLLSKSVSIWDGMKKEMITYDSFKKVYDIEPSQFVDVGSLCGDSSDNIIAVPSVGEKTALKWIQVYGNWQAVIVHLKGKYKEIKDKFPDVKGDEFERLKNIRTPAEEKKFQNKEEWKGKYPEIKSWMSYTGVALAFEEKRWIPSKELKKKLKTNLLTLMFEERVKLAYSLKKMDDEIPNLPMVEAGRFDKEKLEQYLEYYDIYSLQDDIDIFGGDIATEKEL